MIPLLLLITAAISYFLGSLNGALILSRYVFRKDIRKYGSGNAGYTNFVRVFGSKWGPAVIAVDILKTVIAVLVGALLMSFPGEGFPVVGKLFAHAFALTKAAGLPSVRIDTHPNNKTMQNCCEKNGFTRCGLLTVKRDGSRRIMYHWVRP